MNLISNKLSGYRESTVEDGEVRVSGPAVVLRIFFSFPEAFPFYVRIFVDGYITCQVLCKSDFIKWY